MGHPVVWTIQITRWQWDQTCPLAEGYWEYFLILCKLFSASLAFRYNVYSWKLTWVSSFRRKIRRVTRKPNLFGRLACCPSIWRHLRTSCWYTPGTGHLRSPPLCQSTRNITGRSYDLALPQLVCKIQKALDDRDIAIAFFWTLTSKGAFDNNRTSVIKDSAREHIIDELTCGWISEILKGRIESSLLLGASKTVSTTRECPQGGALPSSL